MKGAALLIINMFTMRLKMEVQVLQNICKSFRTKPCQLMYMKNTFCICVKSLYWSLRTIKIIDFSGDSNPSDLIGRLSRFDVLPPAPDFYQILPIYHKILKTRGKLLIFRIFGDLSLWNTHIILTFFAKSIMVCYNSGRNDVKIQEMALERT